MMIKAKPLLKDKFWIVENNGERIGTIALSEERYMLTKLNKTVEFFDTERQLKDKLGTIHWDSAADNEPVVDKILHGFPCAVTPFNTVYDIQRKLPLFTKSEQSKSLYCAGYYIIKFDKGWVKSFCPKLITVERYECKGPFKTEFEMKQELSRVN